MRSFPAIALLSLLAILRPCLAWAQEKNAEVFEPINQVLPGAPPGSVGYDFATGTLIGTNVLIQRNGVTLMADSVKYNQGAGLAEAQGHVWVEEGGQMLISSRITYNFNTHVVQSGKFRLGHAPVYAQGDEEQVDITNRTSIGRNLYVTTDNISKPAYYVRAGKIILVPGKYFEAWNAVLYVKGVPLFYYPYYRRSLDLRANHFIFTPGDDSLYGPFLLSSYIWRLNNDVDGRIHLDYREKRGVAAGPDLNLHLNRWGDAQFKYYYLHDLDSNKSINDDTNDFQRIGSLPKNRQRFYTGWQATPYTNFNAKALVNYQSDQLVEHDFIQSEYGQNPQPGTFVEANKYWDNWSLDAESTPRINSFFDQVERLPDLQLTGFRQQIFNTPVYYESQSSVGYYEHYFAGTNTLFGSTNFTEPDFSAMRADTLQQFLLPETFFGWLNVTPRLGGRFTYYGTEQGAGATNTANTRALFNTGVDTSFTASQLWPGARNPFLQVDGLRHIIVPSASYVYVPAPNYAPNRLPQFDTQLPSLLVLPVQFPDYNDIDSIDSRNVIRFGIRNTLQTKRDGQLDNLLDWNVMLDWNLSPNTQTNAIFLQPQKTFDDLYSDLVFKPRSWIALESQLRYDINDNRLNMAFHQLTFTPNDRWNWGIGHWYLHNGFVDAGDDVITSTLFYRLNDNWGLRATHYFNAETGHLQEQFYSIYRDMRSWTTALTFRVIDNGGGQPVDFGFAFTVSLKASPRYHVGDDSVRPYEMLGE